MSVLDELLVSTHGKLKPEQSSGIKEVVTTPRHIAKEIVQAVSAKIPEHMWTPDLKILDIYCKSGVFLDEFRKELLKRTKHYYEKPGLSDKEINKQCNLHIIYNQICGFTSSELCKVLVTREIYGSLITNSNIKYIKNYDKLVNNKNPKLLIETLKEELGEMNMKGFDVVIGNPPYNKGMDLDFVNLGYDLSSNITAMITPAKWQTTADDYSGCASKNIDYKQFREKLVPHMSEVCFYPECKDIFKIGQIDGITWYIMDKDTHEKIKVTNKCKLQPHFNSVSERSLRERERESLHNIGSEIVHSLGNYPRFKFPYVNMRRYEVWVNNQISLGGSCGDSDSCTWTTKGQCKVIGAGYLLDKQKGETSPSGASNCIFSSDSREECENFISWLNTKFTRFFVAINISKLTGILTDDYFRFVPAPLLNPDGTYNWSIKYTDELLYNHYKLDSKYQEVINTVIKERS